MKRCLLLSIMLFLCTGQRTCAQGFLHASDQQIVDGKNNKIILRGMGLGGWMLQEGYMLRVQGIGQQQHVIRQNLEMLAGKQNTDLFYDAWLANHITQPDIDSMAAWGFNSVRLPMHYNLFTLPVESEPVAGKDTWLDRGFQMTDALVKWCKDRNLYVILDLHAAPGGQGNDLNISDRDPALPSLWESEANLQKMISLWRKLAERYVNEPTIGGYDIINEPNWGFENVKDKNGCSEKSNAPLRKLMIDITTAIREADPNHLIIVEGNCWGNNYAGIFPLWDKNTAISFHKYWNFNDEASVKKALEIREAQNAPVWLGESGENSNVWFHDAIQLMERHDIGWAWWPLKKLGGNNPMEIKVPASYQKILTYWQGKGPKPNQAESITALSDLAENLKTTNTVIHTDVVDAMFRQVRTNQTIPFKKYVIQTTRIPASDYDLGREGYAYHDLDSGNYYISTGKQHTMGNSGGAYRNDGVDIYADLSEKFIVGQTETGEWLQYSFLSEKDADVTLYFRLATNDPNGQFSVTLNSTERVVTVIPNTADQWKDIAVKKMRVEKGRNALKFEVVKGGFRFAGFSATSAHR